MPRGSVQCHYFGWSELQYFPPLCGLWNIYTSHSLQYHHSVVSWGVSYCTQLSIQQKTQKDHYVVFWRFSLCHLLLSILPANIGQHSVLDSNICFLCPTNLLQSEHLFSLWGNRHFHILLVKVLIAKNLHGEQFYYSYYVLNCKHPLVSRFHQWEWTSDIQNDWYVYMQDYILQHCLK